MTPRLPTAATAVDPGQVVIQHYIRAPRAAVAPARPAQREGDGTGELSGHATTPTEDEEELRALIAVENECCSWATWTMERDAGTFVLDVRSTGEGIATLHGMFALASGG